ncbi:DUF349 domain-containing protein [Brachybacterium sp. AOP25-B2-12]|uniref:DUF349 domain-containing protein n=1 Tax=Brachybacterium sp. AOP25-B2-12 TaxID=3457710 RepID=UPI00403376F1
MSESTTPSPSPAPRPTPPRPGAPRPAAPSPAALAGRATHAPLVPVVAPDAEHDEAEVAAALAYGSVDEERTIAVQDGTQKRPLGTADEGTSEEDALRPFAHAYLDLVSFLDLSERKLAVPGLSQAELNRILEQLRKRLKDPQVVGDVPALRARAAELREKAKGFIQEIETERTAAREAALARRTEFVESIEALVATDPSRISWRSAGETMRQMVPTWKQLQSEDKNLDRATEDALWKRLSAARGAFDRVRKQFFSGLDEQHAEAEKVKEALIVRAEALRESTDWGPTVRSYRELMDEWRAAPRGNRRKDDAQWARFKAAQDTFFTARNADLEASDAEQRENLTVKEALLTEAEALVPVEDVERAAAALRRVQDRWESAGKVPRADIRRVEDRLHAVERAVKQAEDAEWRRTDPRTRERVQGASSQLHAAIAEYEDALAAARDSGDPRRIDEAEKALAARQEWLAVIERSARDLG